MGSQSLSEEDRKKLEALEQKFAKRYTEEDKEFVALLNRELPPPPVVHPWSDDTFWRQGNNKRRWSERGDNNSPRQPKQSRTSY